MKILLLYYFLTFPSTIQNDDYSIWVNRMKNNVYLKEMLNVGKESKARIDNNYYGNDLPLIKKIDKDCFKSEASLALCLKKVGFKKAEEFSKSIFLNGFYWAKFLEQYPTFYKLDKEVRFKLLKQFNLDNASKPLLM